MTVEPRPQSESVRQGLDRIQKQTDTILKAALAMMQADSGAVFPVDLLASGAVKRHVSTAAAFALIIENRNLVSARALLRLEIDTALRFSAAWLVKKPHEFANRILDGEHIDRMKDEGGERLTDRRLVTVRSKELPWLPEVYERLSGYVHLSGSHIFASMEPSKPVVRGGEVEGYSVGVSISATDEGMPEGSWLEIIGCFLETAEFFLTYLQGWTETKKSRPTPKEKLPPLPPNLDEH